MDKKDYTQEIIDKLKEDLLNYEIFFNNSSEGFLIHRDGKVIVANKKALEIIGLELHEVINFTIFDFVDEQSKKIIQENIKNKYEGANELIGIKKNGEKINLLVTSKEIIYRDKPARAVFIRDITEDKKKLEKAKQEKSKIEKQRKSLVSMAKLSSKVGVMYEDIIGIIVEIATITLNALSGGFFILSDDKKNLKPVAFKGEYENNKSEINFNDVLKKHIEDRITIFDKIEDIKLFFPWLNEPDISLILSPVRFEDDFIGVVIFFKKDNIWEQYDQDFVASVADIIMLTFERWNRKWAEIELEQNLEQMKKLNQIKSDFISMISHELRTPLTAIIGFVSLLLKGITGKLNEQQIDFVKSIDNNSRRLLQIVNELLDISRIEKGTFAIIKSEINIVELIDTILEDMRVVLELKKVKVIKNFQKDKIIISADPDRLKQVVTNIIDNAIKYSYKDLEIKISIECIKGTDIKNKNIENLISSNNQYILLSIKDNGIGISKENLEKIFNMFTQLEDINTRKRGGVGLGLYIAHQIIKQHNGFIWAESEGLEKGTTFNILLPVN